jgi:aldehyde dehydrogenase
VQEALAVLRAHGVRARYENFIGGKWVAPIKGAYFVDSSPIDSEPLCEVARSTAADVEKALDAAHAARDAWGRTAPAVRAKVLQKIADRMEEGLELLALAESMDNGKPIRETRNADVPLSIDTSVTLPAVSGAKKVVSARLTMTRWPTTSRSL